MKNVVLARVDDRLIHWGSCLSVDSELKCQQDYRSR